MAENERTGTVWGFNPTRIVYFAIVGKARFKDLDVIATFISTLPDSYIIFQKASPVKLWITNKDPRIKTVENKNESVDDLSNAIEREKK